MGASYPSRGSPWRLTVTVGPGGEIKNVKVVQQTHPIFGRYSAKAVEEVKCVGQGHDVAGVRIPFVYRFD